MISLHLYKDQNYLWQFLEKILATKKKLMEQKWSERSRRVCDNDPKKEPRVMKKRQRATKQKNLEKKWLL